MRKWWVTVLGPKRKFQIRAQLTWTETYGIRLFFYILDTSQNQQQRTNFHYWNCAFWLKSAHFSVAETKSACTLKNDLSDCDRLRKASVLFHIKRKPFWGDTGTSYVYATTLKSELMTKIGPHYRVAQKVSHMPNHCKIVLKPASEATFFIKTDTSILLVIKYSTCNLICNVINYYASICYMSKISIYDKIV